MEHEQMEQQRSSESGKTTFADDQSAAETADLGFRAKTKAIVEEGQIDPLYQAKAQILNDAIQDIGMGKYQWHLFCVAGFGWLSDNVFPRWRVLSVVMACGHWANPHSHCV
jgi:hypothetical protein